FDGLIGCDYFSAYRKYMKHSHVLVQFCLAHLIRDVKFLVAHPDADNRRYGTLLLKASAFGKPGLRKLIRIKRLPSAFSTGRRAAASLPWLKRACYPGLLTM